MRIYDDKYLEEVVDSRNKAITAFVMNDDLSAVITYFLNYGIQIPDNEDVLKLAVWKSALEVTNLPKEVKDTATKKIAQWREEFSKEEINEGLQA